MGMLTDGDPRPQLVWDEDATGAKQSHKEECDVNQIMEKFQRTGVVTHLARGVPQFLDVSEVGDYRTALDQVRMAQEWFAGLPSSVRAEFANDPAEFLDALEDPAQHDFLEELGLSWERGGGATTDVAETPQPPAEPEVPVEGPADA